MLEFFRKYQKIFFVFVTAIIVISFTFFGAFNTFTAKEEIPNRLIGKAIDGSKMMEMDVMGIQHIFREGEQPHLLSDGWVHEKWLLTDLAETLALTYFDELKEELSEKVVKVCHFMPYVHPGADFLSGAAVWEQFAPEINKILSEMKAAPEQFSKEQVSKLFALYRAQAPFPSHLLRQMLFYQQAQYSWLKPDPALPRADLAVAGLHTIEEWFGPKFASLLCQTLLNGAALAEKRGYAISMDQARNELMRNVYRNLKEYAQNGKPPSMEEVQKYYQNMVRSSGMSEASLVQLWSRAALCRLLFEEVGQAAFVDSLAAREFFQVARRKARIESYTLEPSLNSFDDLLKLEAYLEAVSVKVEPLDIPNERRSLDQVAETHPELVQKRYKVKWKEVDESSLAARISLKETWEWQLNEDHFRFLGDHFALWGGKVFETQEERFEALEGLNPATRAKVDQLSRKQISLEHPEWVDQAFAKEPSIEKEIVLSLSGKAALFGGHLSSLEACALLDRHDHHSKLHFGEGSFYAIDVEERLGEELISFDEAARNGILDQMVENLLVTAYAEMVGEWTDEEGSAPAFEEKKEEIARLLFTDILHALDGNIPFESLGEYAKARSKVHLEKAYESARNGQALPWGVHIETRLVGQGDDEGIRAFNLEVGDFSDIQEGKFFSVLAFEEGSYEERDLQAIKAPLALEAQKELMQELLSKIQEKQAVSFKTDE